MADMDREFGKRVKAADKFLEIVAVVIVVSIAVTVVAMVLEYLNNHMESMLGYFIVIAGQIFALGLMWVIRCMMLLAFSSHVNLEDSAGRLSRLETLMQVQTESSKRLEELAELSDQAKSLVFRDTEMEAFRENINACIVSRNFTGALALADTIEKKFGYVEEAQKFREEVAASRKATADERVDKAIANLKQIVAQRDYTRAAREVRRVQTMFPNHPKTVDLPKLVKAERNKQKRELLQEYGESVRKNDVDRGIELLKELDRYLTPTEAAALQESARGVFKAHLHNLGVQFSIAASEGQWDAAISAGQNIIQEFPNSKMALEVREKMPLLKSRLAGGARSEGFAADAAAASGGDK